MRMFKALVRRGWERLQLQAAGGLLLLLLLLLLGNHKLVSRATASLSHLRQCLGLLSMLAPCQSFQHSLPQGGDVQRPRGC